MPTARCPECSQTMEVEYVDNGVCMVWHGVHCGWGHVVSSGDVRMPDGSTGTPEMASPPMAGDSW